VRSCGLDACCSVYGPMEGSCEHGNETSGSIKGGEVLDYLGVASQKGLCSMELVTIHSFFQMFE